MNAQFGVGEIYRRGMGASKNYVLCYLWLSLAAGGGDTNAMKLRQSAELGITREQITESEILLKNWKP